MPTFTFLYDDPLNTTIQNERGEQVYVVETNERDHQTSIFKMKSREKPGKMGAEIGTRLGSEGVITPAQAVHVGSVRLDDTNTSQHQPLGHPESLIPGRARTLPPSRPTTTGNHTTSFSVNNLPRHSSFPHSSRALAPTDPHPSKTHSPTESLALSLEKHRSRMLVARITWNLWGDDRITSRITHGFALHEHANASRGSSSNEKYSFVNTDMNGTMKEKDSDGMVTAEMTSLMSLIGWIWHKYYLLKMPNGARYKWDIWPNKEGSYGLYTVDHPTLVARFTPSQPQPQPNSRPKSSHPEKLASFTIYDTAAASIPSLLDIFVVSCIFVVRRARWVKEWREECRARAEEDGGGCCSCRGGGGGNCGGDCSGCLWCLVACDGCNGC